MIEITASYVDTLAPNSAAIKNAQGLVKKKKFVKLNRSEDGSLLFGECAGSGSSNYHCSADFVQPDKPVFRCSCPSRQFPCKHSLGILYAYTDGLTFETAEVPEDLTAKREKAEKREEKKAQAAAAGPAEAKPKKVNKSALKKKVNTQLEGLDLAEKLVVSLIRGGLGTIDAKSLKTLNEQVKQLGGYYLPGAQNELRRLALLLGDSGDRELLYTLAIEQLSRIHALIKKGRARLTAKLEDPELAPDTESTTEEWLGYAWQLSELKEAGLVRQNAALLQLSFHSYDDEARKEFVDFGLWADLGTGEIHKTIQYRPYKAAKLMREEDSCNEVAVVPELVIYPGDLNRRVRFESMTLRAPEAADWEKISQSARRSYADAVKTVRNQLKNPLADPLPVLLLHVRRFLITTENEIAIEDESGQRLALGQTSVVERDTAPLLQLLDEELREDVCLLAAFEHQPGSGRLVAQPLAVVKGSRRIRLL